ncbi:MAG: hypothetical protein ACI4VF_05285 [Lachnospirales bacterium]
MGKSIYLTNNEIIAIRATCNEWQEMMRTGEDTFDLVDERHNEGLKSALEKLYKS